MGELKQTVLHSLAVSLSMKYVSLPGFDRPADEERASAHGETDISRKLANPHRALRTTRQSNTRTTALIFRVFVRSEGELYEVSISM